MKKTLSIVALLFCCATTYAQAAKPTKQETMDWIASKFQSAVKTNEQYVWNNIRTDVAFIYKYSFLSYKEGKVSIIENFRLRSSDKSDITVYEIDLNKINRVVFEGHVILGTNLLKTTKGDVIKYENQANIFIQYQGGDIISFIDFEAEPNLSERMNKAFTLLAGYNNEAKPKEKF